MAKRFDVFGLIGLVLLVAVWQLLTFAIPLIALPHPAHVAERIAEDFIVAEYLLFYGLPETGLLDSMIYTTQNVLIAVALGASVGTVCGLVTARFDLVRAVIDPVLMVLGTIPILVLAPFFLIWFGIGRTSAVLLVAIYVAVILYIYAQRAASTGGHGLARFDVQPHQQAAGEQYRDETSAPNRCFGPCPWSPAVAPKKRHRSSQ